MNCHECYHKYQQKIMFHCNSKRQLTNLIFRLHYRQTLTGCDYIFVENCTFSNSLHLYGTSLIKRNALSCNGEIYPYFVNIKKATYASIVSTVSQSEQPF